MRAGAADHRDHQRRARQPLALEFDLVGRGVGVALAEDLGDGFAGLFARFAFEHQEAPGRELAVVGHARSNGEQGFKLGRRRAGVAQFYRLDRAAGLQERKGIGHWHLNGKGALRLVPPI